jgi:hypothetical protein
MPVIESLSSNRASDVIPDKHRPALLSYSAPCKHGNDLRGTATVRLLRTRSLSLGHAITQEQRQGFNGFDSGEFIKSLYTHSSFLLKANSRNEHSTYISCFCVMLSPQMFSLLLMF